jgi:predicted membrane protein
MNDRFAKCGRSSLYTGLIAITATILLLYATVAATAITLKLILIVFMTMSASIAVIFITASKWDFKQSEELQKLRRENALRPKPTPEELAALPELSDEEHRAMVFKAIGVEDVEER